MTFLGSVSADNYYCDTSQARKKSTYLKVVECMCPELGWYKFRQDGRDAAGWTKSYTTSAQQRDNLLEECAHFLHPGIKCLFNLLQADDISRPPGGRIGNDRDGCITQR